MTSKHYKAKRYKREKLIEEQIGSGGYIVDSFFINKGHKNGLEKHCILSNGVIVIYNAISGKICTKKIARPGQIRALYKTIDKEPPEWLIELAIEHQKLGYNRM